MWQPGFMLMSNVARTWKALGLVCTSLGIGLLTSVAMLAASPATRTVKFPEKIQIGRIYQAISANTPGRFLGPASGAVTIPADTKLFLVLDPRTAQRPEVLAGLAPDAIYAMRVKFGEAKDPLLQSVSRLSDLAALDVVEGDFSNAGIAKLSNLKKLERLTLINCMIDGTCLAPLKGLQKLNHLDASDNVLTPAGVEAVSNLSSLTQLVIARTAVNDKELAGLTKLKHLEHLDISGNRAITINGLIPLKACARLSNLRIRNTSISPRDLLQLKGLPLTNVELSVYEIDKDELEALNKAFPKCRYSKLNKPNQDEQMFFAPLKH